MVHFVVHFVETMESISGILSYEDQVLSTSIQSTTDLYAQGPTKINISLSHAQGSFTEAEAQPPELLQCFSGILKAFYKGSNFFMDTNIGKVEFINLALVKKQNINEVDKLNDKFLQDSLHGLVDDIIRKKRRIKSHKHIFNYGIKGTRKIVLVEGSPGVGKTMLAKKLCRDWADGNILMEYEIVLLIPLRRFQS